MQIKPAARLNKLPPYLFVAVDEKKRAALAAGRPVIDFGVGDPDLPTPNFIVQGLHDGVARPENHRYPLGPGSRDFREAVARFFHRRYRVQLDWQTEVSALIGSKEGLGHLPLALINPGDISIVPQPGYPVYQQATILAGGEPWILPLTDEGDWLPDFDAIPPDIAARAKLLFINYPNNPTGACATRSIFEKAVSFARTHNVLLVQDAAYNDLYLTEPPPSILQTPGARDVAVELHSLSKTFNMTGWRAGFIVGRPDVIHQLRRIKAVMDSGLFGAIQDAAVAALEGYDRPELAELRTVYRRRAARLVDGLNQIGFSARVPQATFYIWARVPADYDSMTASAKLLDHADVVCVPGAGFGETAANYVRFACTVPEEQIETAVARMQEITW